MFIIGVRLNSMLSLVFYKIRSDLIFSFSAVGAIGLLNQPVAKNSVAPMMDPIVNLVNAGK